MKNNLLRNAATPLILALGLTLSACGGTKNAGLEPVHQPVVNRLDYALDLNTDGGGGLTGGEQQRLAAWFDTLRVGYGDRIAIDDPSPYGSAASRDSIATVAARYGLLLDDGAPVTTGEVAGGMVRVVVSRMSASVPRCPDWSRASQPEFEASSMSNLGCATASNLAAMVANPEDLIHGQTGSTDQRVSSKAIKTYRDKTPTGAAELTRESSKEGK
jgi:pilus assembly protein CpaD